jgi:hypothetical protein
MNTKSIVTTFLISLLFAGCVDRKIKVYPVDGFAVAGRATYVKHTPSVSFLGITKRSSEAPIACARVLVLDTSDNNRIITEGATNENGVFNIGLPLDLQNSPLVVRVLTVSSVENFPMMVINQDSDPMTYFAESNVFIGTKNNLDLHVTTPLKGAFNVFAQIMRGYKFMTTSGGEAETEFPELEVRWESGDVGIDCTCFFVRFLQPDVISLREDEDDDSVILHEFGHYLHYSFSSSSSLGGEHIISCDQNDDPRLTWAEGWATGFSLIVRRSSYYIDTGNQHFYVEHETPCHIGQGSVSESIVAAMYLDLYDGSTNDMLSTDADTISISFLNIWKAMKDINLGLSRTVYDYYLALLARGSVTAQQWQDNFGALGLDEATMITHSSPSSPSPPSSPHVPPSADPEFHSFLVPE